MSAQRKDVVRAKKAKRKATRAITVDRGSHSVSGPVLLSKDDSPPTTVPNPRPPKIPVLEELDFGDPSLLAGLERAFGTNDLDFICSLMFQAFSTDPRWAKNEPDSSNALLATLHGIAPRDALEGLLAVQMVGVHGLAMHLLARAANGGSPGEVDVNTNSAVKLLRTFTAQLETLNRHRGKIPQPIVVGNVNVSDGGQAIVGPVNHPGPGKVPKGDEEKKVG